MLDMRSRVPEPLRVRLQEVIDTVCSDEGARYEGCAPFSM